MANHKSALKQHKQDLRHRDRNRWHRARTRTAVKKCRAAIAEGDVDAARHALAFASTLLDRTAKVGAIHTNAASRTKSRLALAINRMGQAG